MTPEPARKPRLLMIEDNPGDVSLFRWALERSGVDCELSVITDGGAALDFIKHAEGSSDASTPDLVILDLNLPKASGSEVLTAMRATALYAQVPVIVWTSSNAPSDRAQLNALRVKHYLVKPPDLDEFLKLGGSIKQLLEEQSAL